MGQLPGLWQRWVSHCQWFSNSWEAHQVFWHWYPREYNWWLPWGRKICAWGWPQDTVFHCDVIHHDSVYHPLPLLMKGRVSQWITWQLCQVIFLQSFNAIEAWDVGWGTQPFALLSLRDRKWAIRQLESHFLVGDPSKIRPYSYLTGLLLSFLSLPSVPESPKTREKQNNYIKKTALKCKTTSVTIKHG